MKIAPANDHEAKRRRKRRLKIAASVAATLVIAAAAAPWLIKPACPKRIVILTGSEEGAYYAFAQRYRELLAKDGVELEVVNTAGSVENLQRLAESDATTLAMVQGGTATGELAKGLESLASLYLEPVWVFYRGEKPIDRLTRLEGKKIAVDAPGSGTRAIALKLLKGNDLATGQEPAPQTTTVPLGGRAAVEALKRGEVDAAFFAISPRSPLIRELLEADGIQLMSFRRAAAYQRKYPFLSSVTLSEGLLDLKANVPKRDIVLLAPTANLVARDGLHPALAPLFLKAVTQVHEEGGFLEEPGVFPSPRHVDFPLNADARRWFKSGPTLLFRYLPFSVAVWIDRVKMMLFPLLTLLVPLLKTAPPLYRWQVRSRFYGVYRELRRIDEKMQQAVEGEDFAADAARLRELNDEVTDISVPVAYMDEFYALRLHVWFMLQRIAERESSEPRVRRLAA